MYGSTQPTSRPHGKRPLRGHCPLLERKKNAADSSLSDDTDRRAGRKCDGAGAGCWLCVAIETRGHSRRARCGNHRACGQGSSLHEGPVNTRSALHVRFPTPQRTCVTSAMAPPRCVLWNFATNAARANPAPGASFRDCSNGCPEMVVVQQGRFTMGAPAGEEARENLPDQRRGRSVPQHLVTIRHKLAIAKFDVTRDEYAQFVAETNRPYPDSCDTLNASGTFIATNGNWHSPGFPQTGRDP